MKALYKQLYLGDFVDDFDKLVKTQSTTILTLFEEYLDISSFIPHSFYQAYYSNTGHPREYTLEAMVSAFIFQKLFSIPNTALLITFLEISSELRAACGFTDVPHKSQFSRFLTDFYQHINSLFHKLVDITQPICNEIDSFKSSILISDTTGFEAYVKENNPKFFSSLLLSSRKLAKAYKDNDTFDPYIHACSKMPKKAAANEDISYCYLSGHFGYFLKANIVSNGLGILRHIDFYEPTDIDLSSDLPSEAKDKYDSKTLIPVLENFFTIHSNFKYDYFLGDAGFDCYDNYEYLYKDKQIIPLIPINQRNQQNLPKPGFNELGIPTCPNEPSLEMQFDGITREKGRADRIKWLCPKSKKAKINGKTTYLLSCDSPCSSSSCGRVVQTYVNEDYRLNCPIPRNSEKWDKLYKVRTVCERAIAQLKSLIAIESTRLQNTVSIKSNILFAGIAQLVALILLYKTNKADNPMAIKSIAS